MTEDNEHSKNKMEHFTRSLVRRPKQHKRTTQYRNQRSAHVHMRETERERESKSTSLKKLITYLNYKSREIAYETSKKKIYQYLNQPYNIVTVQLIVDYPTSQLVPLTLLPTIYWYSVFSHLQQQNGLWGTNASET